IYFRRMSRESLKESLIKDFGVTEKLAEKLGESSFGRIGLAVAAIEKEPAEKNKTLLADIEEEVLKLRKENLKKNASTIRWLLHKESLLTMYNLNENLQRKSIEYYLQ